MDIDRQQLITGKTRIVFMIGQPVAQTRSPVLFNAHFVRTGRDCAMVPLEVAPQALTAFVSMVRAAPNCEGFVATLPHKRALLGLVDEAGATARALGGVNVVRRLEDGTLVGDMADGAGFWNGVRDTAGFDPASTSAIVAGAGAAATAIAFEFAARGGRRLRIWSREEAETAGLCARLSRFGLIVESGMPDTLAPFDIAINATPLGMTHAPGTAFAAELVATLPAHAVVADAITEPAETELLALARHRGLRTVDGGAMTEGQFARLLDVLGLATEERA